MNRLNVVNVITHVIFDVVPTIIGIFMLVMLVMYVPELFVGMFLGYMYGKHQDECNDAANSFVVKVEALRQKTTKRLSRSSANAHNDVTTGENAGGECI